MNMFMKFLLGIVAGAVAVFLALAWLFKLTLGSVGKAAW